MQDSWRAGMTHDIWRRPRLPLSQPPRASFYCCSACPRREGMKSNTHAQKKIMIIFKESQNIRSRITWWIMVTVDTVDEVPVHNIYRSACFVSPVCSVHSNRFCAMHVGCGHCKLIEMIRRRHATIQRVAKGGECGFLTKQYNAVIGLKTTTTKTNNHRRRLLRACLVHFSWKKTMTRQSMYSTVNH